MTILPELPPSFEVRQLAQGTTHTVVVEGEVDLGTIDEVTEALGSALSAEPEIVVLDLSAVSYMDSTGIHGILDAKARADDQDVRFVVIPSEPVSRLFTLCSLNDLLLKVESRGRS